MSSSCPACFLICCVGGRLSTSGLVVLQIRLQMFLSRPLPPSQSLSPSLYFLISWAPTDACEHAHASMYMYVYIYTCTHIHVYICLPVCPHRFESFELPTHNPDPKPTTPSSENPNPKPNPKLRACNPKLLNPLVPASPNTSTPEPKALNSKFRLLHPKPLNP